MAQVVDADVRDLSLHAHPFPEALEVDHRLARDIAGEEERAALWHCIPAQTDQCDSLMRDRHAVDAALFGVGRLLGTDRKIDFEQPNSSISLRDSFVAIDTVRKIITRRR